MRIMSSNVRKTFHAILSLWTSVSLGCTAYLLYECQETKRKGENNLDTLESCTEEYSKVDIKSMLLKHLFKNFAHMQAKDAQENVKEPDLLAKFSRQNTYFESNFLPDKSVKLTSREKRFIRFASVEFDGQLYLTPRDFLQAVVENHPRPRFNRKKLSKDDVNRMRDDVLSLNRDSNGMFQKLRNNGIVSYTEYLFLLSVLIKTQNGFKIAFSMFDTDGNETVDKNEYLELENIFSNVWKEKRGISNGELETTKEYHERYVDDEQGLQRKHSVDTTLLVHFFGKGGKEVLRFEELRTFMENLQNEVLQLEFSEYAQGQQNMSEIDFAKALLRYSYSNTRDYEKFVNDALVDLKEESGISFEEFKYFCQFLNNLDDFVAAMKIFSAYDREFSKEQLHHAINICVGGTVSQHLIDVVFIIFDKDKNGKLSYHEFVTVMKNRQHRRYKSKERTSIDMFKACVHNEMR